MECQICFCGVDLKNCYRCNVSCCKKIMCYDCINVYIKHTELLLCACTKPISPLDLPVTIENLGIYEKSILRQIEMKNFDKINYQKDYKETIEFLREERRKIIKEFPVCIQFTIETCYSKEMKKISKEYDLRIKEANNLLKKVNFANICGNNWCNGQLAEEGTRNLKCTKCETLHCVDCKEIVKNGWFGHECKKEDLESLKFIQEELFKCPNCNLSIQKSSGCSYITCAGCNTKFDHTTGEIGNYGGHSKAVKIYETENLSRQMKGKVSRNLLGRLTRLEEIVAKEPNVDNIVKAYANQQIEKAIGFYFAYLEEKAQHDRYLEQLKKLNELKKVSDVVSALNNLKI